MLIRAFGRVLLAVGGLAIGVAGAQAQSQDDSDAPKPAAPAATRPETPPTPPLSWVPKGAAVLQILDKVNARHNERTVRVGEQIQVGPLRIEVQACSVHLPNQPLDATAFLVISDVNNEGVPFRGWMVASQPALSMLQHPVYDVRVTGCR